MWFQLIAEVGGFLLVVELLLRMCTKQGIWGALKSLAPTHVQEAMVDIVEHPYTPNAEDDSIAELRHRVSDAEEELRLAEREGELTGRLTALRKQLATARGQLTKATRNHGQGDSRITDGGRS